MSANYTNERNPNRIYYRGGSESETRETATNRKEYDGEGGPIHSPDGNCPGGCGEGCEGSHERAEEEEEVDENVFLLKRCNFITNKEIKKLIRGCDDLINGIESDLAFARSGLKGSKRNRRSKYNKEIRLIRDCDDLIDGLESDL